MRTLSENQYNIMFNFEGAKCKGLNILVEIVLKRYKLIKSKGVV
jgi:hypothetical protein